MILSRSSLERFAPYRKTGYVEAVLSMAHDLGNDNYELTDEQAKTITDEYRLPSKQSLGLGDAIASVATPIARALHLPCIDPITNELRSESPCAKKKARLNKAIPNINPLA